MFECVVVQSRNGSGEFRIFSSLLRGSCTMLHLTRMAEMRWEGKIDRKRVGRSPLITVGICLPTQHFHVCRQSLSQDIPCVREHSKMISLVHLGLKPLITHISHLSCGFRNEESRKRAVLFPSGMSFVRSSEN